MENVKVIESENTSSQKVDGKYTFHYFSNDVVGITLSKKNNVSQKYTRETIRNMYRDPFANAKKLQEASVYFYQTNGHYQRMIDYLSDLVTLDHIIYPEDITKISGDKYLKLFEQSAMELNKLNIKHNLRKAINLMLIKGVVYFYLMRDKKSTMFKQIPNELCEAVSIEDGVMRFRVHLKKLNDALALEMPIPIQKAYEKLKGKKGAKEEDEWYLCGDDGVAFNMLGSYTTAFPSMIYMFDSLLSYDETMDEFEDQIKLDSLKLIHQKVPLDKDSIPVLEHDIIMKYHQSTKKALPKSCTIATNPMEIQAINFDKSALRLRDGVTLSEDHLYGKGGISKLLFNNVSDSGEGLKKSIVVDEMMIYPLLQIFKSFIDYELRKISKTSAFKVKFLETTFFNRDESHKLFREDLAFGGSRMLFMATAGMEPCETVGVLKLEREIGIDDLFVPMQTSHTMNSDEPDEGGGQTKDEVTDAGDKSRDNK